MVRRRFGDVVGVAQPRSELYVRDRSRRWTVPLQNVRYVLSNRIFRMLLQRYVGSLGNACSIAQKNELLDRRHKLEARITSYEQRMSVIMKLDDDTVWSTQDDKSPDVDPQPDDEPGDVLDFHPEGWFTPEREHITFPSALAPGEINRLSLESIAMVEAELRK